MYNKLFTKILDSSIWLAPDPHRLVWITLIAAMDRDGFAQFACIENLAARARVSAEETAKAVEAFLSPDPYDPEQDFEGRRIEKVPGGWLILNAEKYRSMVTQAVASEQAKLRMRAYRDRQAAAKSPLRNVTKPLRRVTPSEAVADTDSDTKKEKISIPSGSHSVPEAVQRVFDHWRKVWNHQNSALDAKRTALIGRALKGYTADQLCEAISGYTYSPHHTGQNNRNTVYDGLHLLLRDSDHIDAGLRFARAPPELSSELQQHNVAVLSNWRPPELRNADQRLSEISGGDGDPVDNVRKGTLPSPH